MNSHTIRTRLKERPVYFDVKSLKEEDISNFIRNGKLHESAIGISYLEQIINHFTSMEYIGKANQLAQLGT